MTKNTLAKILALFVLLGYIGVIIFAALDARSAMSVAGINDPTKEYLHLIEYAILYVLIIWVLLVWDKLNLPAIVMTAILCLAAGGLDEYHQSVIPGRNASYFDLFKDGLGIFFAWYAVSCWYIRREEK